MIHAFSSSSSSSSAVVSSRFSAYSSIPRFSVAFKSLRDSFHYNKSLKLSSSTAPVLSSSRLHRDDFNGNHTNSRIECGRMPFSPSLTAGIIRQAHTINNTGNSLVNHLSNQNNNNSINNTNTRQLIIKLLQNIGSRAEVEQYLKYYSSLDIKKFAVIKVGGGILLNELEILSDSLDFMANVGLLPVVIHGSGPQLNDELRKENIVSDFIGGMRVTTPVILQTARRVFQRENLRLVKELEDRGTRARPIVSGIFQAEILDKEKYGLVGKITKVDPTPVLHALESGQLPVLTCMGETESGQYLNINADVAAQELAKSLKPAKIVYLSTNGGLNDENGQIMPTIDLDLDYERLMNSDWFKHGDRLKLKEIKTLLDELPISSSVAITSAANLPKELFTHKGSGTLVRRSEKIYSYNSFDSIDLIRLRELIENSFGGELIENYFELLKSNIYKIYLNESYTAVAIITKDNNSMDSIPYLDKFAVNKLNQSEGVGNTLWNIIKKEIPQLYWRSRITNSINSWYFDRSTGSFHSKPDWIIFWYGIDKNFPLINQLIDTALMKKPSIKRGGKSSIIHNEINEKSELKMNNNGNNNKNSTTSGSINPDGRRSFSTATRSLRLKPRVGIIGARGHTGAELLNLAAHHSSLDITVASSRSLKGQKLNSVFTALPKTSWGELEFTDLQPHELHSQQVDLWVLALPNDLSIPYVKALDNSSVAKSIKLVDLSADHRFNPNWIYGLVERPGMRQEIMNSNRISNPGCYATGMQLSLMPLLNYLNPASIPTVFGISGYSGAGTNPSRKNNLEILKNNIIPYSLQNHMHEKEVSYQLNVLYNKQMNNNNNNNNNNNHNNNNNNNSINQQFNGIQFIPHVSSWFSGISLSIALQIKPELFSQFNDNKFIELYKEYYKNEKLIEILPPGEIPEVRDSTGRHTVRIGGFSYNSTNGRLIICATLDNLLKGAATQCLQNMNLTLGLEEFDGINI